MIYLPYVLVPYHWKYAIGAERIAILLMPVIIQMKEKCVQNVINSFIGLLTKRMTRLPKFNSMNSPRGCIVVRLTKASKYEPEEKMKKKGAASQFELE
jgi:hypothetical protein